MSWSSGKDSALALHEARANGIDEKKITWETINIQLQDQQFAQGKFDAVASFATTSLLNLKQLGVGSHNYHDTYNRFPFAAMYAKNDKTGKKPLLSWRVAILPFIEEDKLWKEFKVDEPWDSDHNKKLLPRMPKVYGPSGAKSEHSTFY